MVPRKDRTRLVEARNTNTIKYYGIFLTAGSAADNRKPESRGYFECGSLSKTQYSYDTAYGGSCNSQKRTTGNAAYRFAAFVQCIGAGREGDICTLGCSGNGVYSGMCL